MRHAMGAKGVQLYTACNLWYEHPQRMWSTGYRKGAIIPAGTAIHNLTKSKKWMKYYVLFVNPATRIQHGILWAHGHHPGTSGDAEGKTRGLAGVMELRPIGFRLGRQDVEIRSVFAAARLGALLSPDEDALRLDALRQRQEFGPEGLDAGSGIQSVEAVVIAVGIRFTDVLG